MESWAVALKFQKMALSSTFVSERLFTCEDDASWLNHRQAFVCAPSRENKLAGCNNRMSNAKSQHVIMVWTGVRWQSWGIKEKVLLFVVEESWQRRAAGKIMNDRRDFDSCSHGVTHGYSGAGGFVPLCVPTPSCLLTANVHCFTAKVDPPPF